MILADTSVWIDHLRSENKTMRRLLGERIIVLHPWIVAELALGSLHDRTRTLQLLDILPQLRVAQLSEVRLMIEARSLHGQGIGLTDAHLLASVIIHPPTLLWTTDKRLRRVAQSMGVHADLD